MANPERSERIAFERKLLSRFFPGARLCEEPHGTYLEYRTGSNGYRHNYHVKGELSANYPYERPDLFLVSPRRLSLLDGSGLIGDPDTLHDFHCGFRESDGRLKICYTDDWDASMNTAFVLLRAMIWIAGLDNYYTRGETIAEYIDRLRDELDDC
jgi:hypothetical protein